MSDFGFAFDNSYLSLSDQFYTRLEPSPVQTPNIAVLNEDLADTLGLDVSSIQSHDAAKFFSGNVILNGAQPFSQAYAGHQFGNFTILGDGRAHVLGEHVTPDGDRFDVQLKGSGRTPYSRGGDGRAVLGPMLREYIISEAMHALGVPTTRSLAVVTTGEDVIRETALPGAVLTRIAKSHIRVGTFQFAATQADKENLEALLNYTIERHDPELRESDSPALDFLKNVIERQADLVVNWMRVGFIHGVMNTDNMTIAGETIDYGPCAFMDSYDPSTVFSSIDHMGRYAYGNQPVAAQWNIARLAEALLPLINESLDKAVEIACEVINEYSTIYRKKWLQMMRGKLGLSKAFQEDEKLIIDLLSWMKNSGADYTNTFRDLSKSEIPENKAYKDKLFSDWYARWQKRLDQENKDKQSYISKMQSHNPAIIPRNHKVEEALNAATIGDLKPFNNLLAAVKTPYNERKAIIPYQSPPLPGERIYQTFCGT